jgi:hypothetical protein
MSYLRCKDKKCHNKRRSIELDTIMCDNAPVKTSWWFKFLRMIGFVK